MTLWIGAPFSIFVQTRASATPAGGTIVLDASGRNDDRSGFDAAHESLG